MNSDHNQYFCGLVSNMRKVERQKQLHHPGPHRDRGTNPHAHHVPYLASSPVWSLIWTAELRAAPCRPRGWTSAWTTPSPSARCRLTSGRRAASPAPRTWRRRPQTQLWDLRARELVSLRGRRKVPPPVGCPRRQTLHPARETSLRPPYWSGVVERLRLQDHFTSYLTHVHALKMTPVINRSPDTNPSE